MKRVEYGRRAYVDLQVLGGDRYVVRDMDARPVAGHGPHKEMHEVTAENLKRAGMGHRERKPAKPLNIASTEGTSLVTG